jgi:hypothetical protein
LTSVTPEGKVKVKLKAWLREHEAYWFMPVQTGYGSTSLDFLACINGAFVALECKAYGKELSPRQELVARQIRAAGGDVYKVTLDKEDGELVFSKVTFVNGELVFTCGLTGSEGS